MRSVATGGRAGTVYSVNSFCRRAGQRQFDT